MVLQFTALQCAFQLFPDKRLYQCLHEVKNQVTSICPQYASGLDLQKICKETACAVESSGDSPEKIFVVWRFLDYYRSPLQFAVVNDNVDSVITEGIIGGYSADK